MARIRTIKPEFPEDETMGRVSRDARLTFVLLWTQCDDHGRFRAATPLLKGHLYPYDEDIRNADLDSWLEELARVGRIHIYEVDGQRYGEVCNWAKHQRIDNAGKSNLPEPPPPSGQSPQLAANRGDSPLDCRKGREGTSSSGLAASCGEDGGESPPEEHHDQAEEDEEEDDAMRQAKQLLSERRGDLPRVANVNAWLKRTAQDIRDTPAIAAQPGITTHPANIQRPDCARCDGLSLVVADDGMVQCPDCTQRSVNA